MAALLTLVFASLLAVPASADREPVLKQIDVPHDYYYREMYLPQLTTGPSSLTWSPDGRTLIYSMMGSLWRQDLDSDTAVQLTDGPGYDYQPDWSPDGNQVAFVRYLNDAMELNVLDLASGTVTALTADGAVNLEPRWSPDGAKLAFVSTRDNGRFHLYVGDVTENVLKASQLLEERRSDVERYYYSEYDHELSPSWSPDGSEILYVGNPEIPYGSGAVWRRPADGSGMPALVRKEETSWRARPDWSPDGKRIAYASYLGRQWHQLWVTTPEGAAEPFPLTYGEFDISNPRWSPDGGQVAYVSNESGNTAIKIQDMVGGRLRNLSIRERQYRKPVGGLELTIVDERNRPVAARVSVTGGDGRSYAPADAWIHADDSFDRSIADFETRYFHVDGATSMTLPSGQTTVTVWRGMEFAIERALVNLQAGQTNSLTIRLQPLGMPADWDRWLSSDVHVHMNYGGTYRNVPARLAQQAIAEDVDVIFNLIVNKEQRVPDVSYFQAAPDSVSNAETLIMHAQEFHTSFWGHMGIIGLNSHLLVPDYSAYPGTAAASIYPDNASIARLAHDQGAAVGYVHPFLPPPPNPAGDPVLTNAFPVDVALGLVDYYEVVGFADPITSAEVWHGLLNCGLKVAAAGGTDAMANYASLRGPVGINRTYAYVPDQSTDPATRQQQWLDALKSGRTLATNGPLIGLVVDGQLPGSELSLENGSTELSYTGFLRSIVPVDHLELLLNGEVIRTFDPGESRTTVDLIGKVTVDESGWLLLRAWNDEAHPMIFDLYPYATTTPVYLNVGDSVARSVDDADYFLAWIDRIRDAVIAHEDFNSADEQQVILGNLDAAAQRFGRCR
ncbi:MAG: CehA/McbA family metallohydrolase [Gammaproteobacteria bacterium]|nr:CehA/McbA family metallohydrolase [Gammaproteobacteria bacterium]